MACVADWPLLDLPIALQGLLSSTIALAFGTDAGPRETNLFLKLIPAIEYPGRSDEAISREAALAAYMSGTAFAQRKQNEKGPIAAGLAVDLAVLSQDLLAIALQQFPATRALMTVVGGEVVWEDPALVRP
jgi:predicted amidohydrolase YtcJ